MERCLIQVHRNDKVLGLRREKNKKFLICDGFKFNEKTLIIGAKWGKLLSVGEKLRRTKSESGRAEKK